MSNYTPEDFIIAKLKGEDPLLTKWEMMPFPHRVPRSFESWAEEHTKNDKLFEPVKAWRRKK